MGGGAISPTKVLYVTGAGRSGSTLLGNILGQLDGVFNAGEVRMIWHRGVLENRACGCGQPLNDCPVWTSILDSGLGGVGVVKAQSYYESTRRLTRMRYMPGLSFSPTRRRVMAASGPHLEVLRRVYGAAAAETAARVIVDTSKVPGYGRALQETAGLEVYVLHLIRDSRAVAHSWSRQKLHPDTGEPMGATLFGLSHPLAAGLSWAVWQIASEIILDTRTRYMRLGYRELIQRPRTAIDLIGGFLGESAVRGAHISMDGDVVSLEPTHTVFGNPGRFAVGSVQLSFDDAWTRKMPPFAQKTVGVSTWPLLHRYRHWL